MMRPSRAPLADPLGPAPLAPGAGDDGGEPVSVLALLNALLRRRALVIGLALGTATLVAGVPLLLPRTYTSAASFMPQSRRTPSNLSGIAAQFGITVPLAEGSESPQFYVDLLRSRETLRAAVDTRYTYAADTGRVAATLVEIYREKAKTPALRREAAMRRLADKMATEISPRTGVVSLEVTTQNAELSRQVAQRLVALVSQFNLERRQSQAGEERRFTEQRLAGLRGELRTAENRLESFLLANREVRNAPTLLFAQRRLEADVNVLRQLVTQLTQAVEQAKIDEVRDTPVITVVARPEAPVRPDPRQLVLRAIVGFLLGAAAGVGLALLQETLRRTGVRRSDEYAAFSSLGRETVGDLTHPWRPLARLFRRGQPAR